MINDLMHDILYSNKGPKHITESYKKNENLQLAFLVQELEKELNKHIKEEEVDKVKRRALKEYNDVISRRNK